MNNKKTSLFVFFIICLFFGACAVPSAADDNDQNSDESNINWVELAKLLASDRAGYDRFGGSVSLDGEYAIVGASQDNDNGNYSGSAYIFRRSGAIWTQQAKLTASDGAENDYFGCSVSLDGEYALIGAYIDYDNGHYSGSVYVFKHMNEEWTQDTKLLPSDGAEYDWFGCSVSLDGEYALIGAYGDDGNGVDAGSAYVFEKNVSVDDSDDSGNGGDGDGSTDGTPGFEAIATIAALGIALIILRRKK